MHCLKLASVDEAAVTQHEVYSNLPRENQKGYACGSAQSGLDEGLVKLKLWMFPQEFYLARVRTSEDLRYTIYGTKVFDENGNPKFIDPVGWAVICEYNKEYLELRFKFPRQCLFMCLFPKQTS